MKQLKLLALVPLVALTGCAVGAYCEGERAYQEAISVPEVQPADGLKPRESASALKIPPAPANPVPYAEPYVDEDGDEAVRCLDKPPEMPALALPPEPAKPAQPKSEEKAPS
jgi:hypothetical protein